MTDLNDDLDSTWDIQPLIVEPDPPFPALPPIHLNPPPAFVRSPEDCDLDGKYFKLPLPGYDSRVLPEHSDYVYLIADGNYCKIGKSRFQIRSRLCELQVGNPRRLRALTRSHRLTEVQAYSFEFEMQQKYKDNHIRGEWFYFTKKQLAECIVDLHTYPD